MYAEKHTVLTGVLIHISEDIVPFNYSYELPTNPTCFCLIVQLQQYQQ